MTTNNKFRGKVTVIGGGVADLSGSVRPNYPIDLPATVSPRLSTNTDLTSKVIVDYKGSNDLTSTVRTGYSTDLQSSVIVRPRNKMSGLVDVELPPSIVARLSPVEDTYAREDVPLLNYGHDKDMFVGTSWGGDRYRSFLRFALDAIPKGRIIKRATLVLGLINTAPSITVGIYDVDPNATWTEYGLTWENQPDAGNIVTSYDGGTYPEQTTVDLSSYVKDWYAGARTHNGFTVRSLQEDDLGLYKDYGTRESDHAPYLEVEYYDPYVYSHDKSQLQSKVFVYGVGTPDLKSSVVVHGYVVNNDLTSSVTARDPKKPEMTDLTSSVGVRYDSIPSKVFVIGSNNVDQNSTVSVRTLNLNEIGGTVTVNKPDLVGSVYVRSHGDLTSKVFVTTPGMNELNSSVGVNSPFVNGTVNVRYYNDINFTVTVRAPHNDDLLSSVGVNSPEVQGSVSVNPYAELTGSVYARSRSTQDLSSKVAVTNEWLNCSVSVRLYSDINASVDVRGWHSDDLNCSVAVTRKEVTSTVNVPYAWYINSTVSPRVPSSNDLASSVYVVSEHINCSVLSRVTSNYELNGSVNPRVKTNYEVNCSVEVRNTTYTDTASSVTSRVGGTNNLTSKVLPRIQSASDVVSTVTVEIQSSIACTVVVRASNYSEINGKVYVKDYTDLPSKVQVFQHKDILCKVTPRFSGYYDVNFQVEVRTPNVSELTCSVEVEVQGMYAFIM